MNRKEYQRNYKIFYKQKNKIVTFPLSNAFYKQLKKRADFAKVKSNTYAKNIVISFLNNTKLKTLSPEQKEFISKYIHISRWVANNINQIVFKTNINEKIDIDILIATLKKYEEKFKDFITNI